VGAHESTLHPRFVSVVSTIPCSILNTKLLLSRYYFSKRMASLLNTRQAVPNSYGTKRTNQRRILWGLKSLSIQLEIIELAANSLQRLCGRASNMLYMRGEAWTIRVVLVEVSATIAKFVINYPKHFFAMVVPYTSSRWSIPFALEHRFSRLPHRWNYY
jgi:hypothetical protein